MIGVAPLNASFTSGASGVIADDVAEGAPRPAEFTALTRKTCATPAARPRSDASVAVFTPSENVVHVEPESVEYSTT
jgi:hypothetical protein